MLYEGFQKDAAHTTGIFVDKTAYRLDTATAIQTVDGGHGSPLDVTKKNLTMKLGSSLS